MPSILYFVASVLCVFVCPLVSPQFVKYSEFKWISRPPCVFMLLSLLCPWALTSDLQVMSIVCWMISGWAVWPQPGRLKVCHSHVHHGLRSGPGLAQRGWRGILEEHRGSGCSRDQERLCGLDALSLCMESVAALNDSKIAVLLKWHFI